MVWFEAIALLNSVVTVFQELCNCKNGLYVTEFEGTFKETVYLQNINLPKKTNHAQIAYVILF